MKKNFFYYLLPSVVRGIISLFIIVPVSTYYLDPEHLGIVAIISVFSGIIVPLSSTGIGWVMGGNYYEVGPQERKELIFNILLVGVLLRAFWVIVLGTTGFLFLPKFIGSYCGTFLVFFWMLLLAEWFNAVWEVVSYAIVLQKRGAAHTFLDMTQLLSHLIVLLVCLVIFKFKTASLVLAYLGSAFGGFIFSVIYIKKYISPRLRWKWIKETVKLGFPTIPLNLFEIISNSIDRFFIERWAGLSALGIYGHSLDYKKMFVHSFKSFSRAFSPEVLQGVSQGDEEKIRYTKQALKKWYGLFTIAGAAVVLFSKEIINILTHGKFTAAAPLVPLWFILIIVQSLGIPYSQFLYAKKRNKFVIFSEIIIGVISWGGIALAINFFGIFGAAAAVVLYFFIRHAVKKIYAMKLGCGDFEGYSFWLSAAVILGLIILGASSLALIFKFFVFIGLSFLAGICFDLFLYFKKLWRLSLGVPAG